MSATKILIVEDDLVFGDLLRRNLQNEGYEVKNLFCGAQTSTIAIDWSPSVILLDYQLPDTDGFQICRQLKAQKFTENIPLIMITGRNSETDMVSALELGIEDFLAKPFSLKVLIAKLKVNLRRSLSPTSAGSYGVPQKKRNEINLIEMFGIVLDRNRHSAFVKEQEIRLTLTQFRLLECFFSLPGFVLSREKIVEELRGQYISITVDNVDVHIANLSKELGLEAGSRIEMLRGVGYRLIAS